MDKQSKIAFIRSTNWIFQRQPEKRAERELDEMVKAIMEQLKMESREIAEMKINEYLIFPN